MCTGELVIGQIAEDTDVYVYIKNITSGYQFRFSATSDENGFVTIDLTTAPEGMLNDNSFYQIWFTLQDSQIDDMIAITYQDEYYNTSQYQCFNLQFTKVKAGDGLATYESHTLEPVS